MRPAQGIWEAMVARGGMGAPQIHQMEGQVQQEVSAVACMVVLPVVAVKAVG